MRLKMSFHIPIQIHLYSLLIGEIIFKYLLVILIYHMIDK